jgi:outer membrane receptor protein involved in Fe transport
MARHSRSQGIARTTLTRGLPLASTLLAAVSSALAQQAPPTSDGLEEIIVTAQKRSEDLQKVPMSIQALSTQKLEENHVASFQDYAKLLPSVTFQDGASQGGGGGPGFARVYMRGVVSGGDGNHSGSQPSVAMYLDEQPITTAQGSLDIHIYDVQRVEALAGPQGTLYGASSQAGTIRIITNKPELGVSKGGYDVQLNTVQNGTFGHVLEGFANLPVGDRAAIRLVGWTEHDSGYVDNTHGTFTYSDGTAGNAAGVKIDNAGFAKKHYNDVTTTGARAALRIDLNDRWTITPAIITQQQKANGFPGFDPAQGDLKVTHYKPEFTTDNWTQAALTVEGKIGNFDLVYAGAFLKRQDETHLDYTDYSIGYDNLYGSASSFVDNASSLIDGSQYIFGKDHYQKYSNELRLSSPKDLPFRFVGGVFQQRQQHEIEQRYFVNGLATSLWVTGWPNTWWLTEEERVDRDQAAFTELSYDILPSLTATAGIRYFKSKNTLQGFFGFGPNNPYANSYGEALCADFPNYTTAFHGAPCTRLNKTVDDSGNTPKVNITWKIDDARMIYATWSKGFRPGGVNRNGAASPDVPANQQIYKPDFLTNLEVGWKTSWMNNRLRFNGAIFQEDWKDFQFAFLGAQSVIVIQNAGQARIRGIESSLEALPTQNLSLSAAIAYYDAKLATNYCTLPDQGGHPVTSNPCPTYRDVNGDPTAPGDPGVYVAPAAPSGTQLPVTPKFKGNVTGRYKFNVAAHEAFVQGSYVYQGASWADLRLTERAMLKEMKAFGTVDASIGVQHGNGALELFVTNALDERGAIGRFGECKPQVCTTTYTQPTQPRTIGLKWGQKF